MVHAIPVRTAAVFLRRPTMTSPTRNAAPTENMKQMSGKAAQTYNVACLPKTEGVHRVWLDSCLPTGCLCPLGRPGRHALP